jgi:hypothetical protein
MGFLADGAKGERTAKASQRTVLAKRSFHDQAQ